VTSARIGQVGHDAARHLHGDQRVAEETGLAGQPEILDAGEQLQALRQGGAGGKAEAAEGGASRDGLASSPCAARRVARPAIRAGHRCGPRPTGRARCRSLNPA
jgi:hypothetical protein